MLATIYASSCCSSPSHTFSLPIILNRLDREGVRLLSPRDSQITSKTSLQVPMKPCRWRNWAQGGARWRSCLLCYSVFQLISSGAQLGRSGICVAFGVVFFHFGSVVGPWLYLDDVMPYSCILWSGDCKPTMYLFPLCITWVVWRLPHLRHFFQCGYASKSCFDTWEI